MRRLALLFALAAPLSAQKVYTRADTLRGSDGPGRAWWDVTFYDLNVKVSPTDSTIRGVNAITYRVVKPAKEMQIDLQQPLVVDSILQGGRLLAWRRDTNTVFVTMRAAQPVGRSMTVTVHYHGRPRVARNPPWDGGFIWKTDSVGNRFIATANQGLGASVWWPNKDWGADEPDSQRVAITVPDPMINVSNGRLRKSTKNGDGTTTWEWAVVNPINNYAISVNAATYAHWTDTYEGEKGKLTLDFYPLAIHLDTARVQWQQVKPMLACFEHWFGPYPWYEDGYKLVETPHLGMEHQSAVAYGNGFKNGYRGRDQSGTGHGMKWDFITVHESGHEWFANNLTGKDLADMWVHESFTNYSEGLYTECQSGKQAGAEYVIGTRRGIRNDSPIVPAFGVHAQGSGDMYPKGGNMLHTIRQMVGNDEQWRGILRGLNKTYWHQTVTGKQVRDYMSREAGIDLDPVFRQYLETVMIPTLEYKVRAGTVSYRWTNVVPGWNLKLPVFQSGGFTGVVKPVTEWTELADAKIEAADLKADPDYYVKVVKVE